MRICIYLKNNPSQDDIFKIIEDNELSNTSYYKYQNELHCDISKDNILNLYKSNFIFLTKKLNNTFSSE